MATSVQYLTWNDSLLSNFTAWGQSVGIALTAFGWTKDTTINGTVNWAGLNYTPFENTTNSLPTAATNYNYRGAWANTGVTYALNDVVTNSGATWYCSATYAPTTASPSPPSEFTAGGAQHWFLFPYEVWFSAGSPTIYLRFEYLGISGVANSTAQPRLRVAVGTSDVNQFTLSSVANASGGNTVYTGTGFNATANAYVNGLFTISGFSNTNNDGTFTCVASTSTTITLNNPLGVAQAQAAAATAFNGNLGVVSGGASGGPTDIMPYANVVQGFSYGQQLACFFSGDSTNRFSMLMWPELSTDLLVNGSGFFCVERSINSSGSYYTTPSGAVTPYWTTIWWGYNGSTGGGSIGSLINTTGSTWITTSFDTVIWTVTSDFGHTNVPDAIAQST